VSYFTGFKVKITKISEKKSVIFSLMKDSMGVRMINFTVKNNFLKQKNPC
jgi:hypothetical protein